MNNYSKFFFSFRSLVAIASSTYTLRISANKKKLCMKLEENPHPNFVDSTFDRQLWLSGQFSSSYPQNSRVVSHFNQIHFAQLLWLLNFIYLYASTVVNCMLCAGPLAIDWAFVGSWNGITVGEVFLDKHPAMELSSWKSAEFPCEKCCGREVSSHTRFHYENCIFLQDNFLWRLPNEFKLTLHLLH